MSEKADYVVSCPYCRRQYRMKLDREEITLKKTRATCGRCGNSFELAPRIADPGAPPIAAAPPAPSVVRRAPPPAPRAEPSPATELESMGRAPQTPSVDTTATVVVSAMKAPAPIDLDAPAAPAEAAEAIAPPSVVIEAPPAEEFDAVESTNAESTAHAPVEAAPVAPPVVEAAPVAPRTWSELADPGLGGLKQESTPALLALEQLL